MTAVLLFTRLVILNGFLSCYLVLVHSSVSAFCFEEAGKYYDINPLLLEAIAYTESSLRPDAFNDANSNGTADYGLMQINSSWFVKISDFGVSQDDVINIPCINVFVGAWILAQNFKSHGENWKSVGAYNAGFSSKKTKVKARTTYINLVKSNLNTLMESRQSTTRP
ncbi:lytic transglycosylase domain-containing protein [Psychromonas aquimarina]|uniref:lytic transglycosylase domain-containing protein n=1 Tax=Psychromonas aquimarina TaxID=444919 RepID=UPI0006849753|nr:lytic transglycosylase domain-containing protein [Psychromonas aquimarina]